MLQSLRHHASFVAGLLFGIILLIASIVFLRHATYQYYDQQVFEQPSFVPATTYHNPSSLKLPILLYHYVEFVKDKKDTIRQGLNTNLDVFEGHLQSLTNNHYTSYFVKDIPDILSGHIPYKAKSVVLTFDDGYGDFYTDAFPLLKKYNIKSTIYIVNDFIGKKNYMTDVQIREIVGSNLVELGSHSMTHHKLTMESLQTAKTEIEESKRILGERFGVKVETFAYPYGSFSPELIGLTKEASYSAAVSVVKGIDQSSDNLFFLSRVRAGAIGKDGMITAIQQLKSKEATIEGIIKY